MELDVSLYEFMPTIIIPLYFMQNMPSKHGLNKPSHKQNITCILRGNFLLRHEL